MPRFKLIFEYDGTHFSGWQKQPNARTVEGVVEKAFSTFYQAEIDVVGQGRTDAGVHAWGQAAHVDLEDIYESGRILHAVNGLLPNDVALLNIEPVHTDFHARFDATSRSYRYQIVTRPSPIYLDYCWYVYSDLNVECLHQCAELIVGEHDFINFCKPPDDEFMTTICTITESHWLKEGKMWMYELTGNRFLRHMVRRLVGTMIQVSKGEMDIREFQNMLTGSEIQKKGHSAPAKGLILNRVAYH